MTAVLFVAGVFLAVFGVLVWAVCREAGRVDRLVALAMEDVDARTTDEYAEEFDRIFCQQAGVRL